MSDDNHQVAVVIGSGFGGSVVACRLARARQRLKRPLEVVLLERGRRYDAADFPRLGLPSGWARDPALGSSKRLPDVARFSWDHDLGLWDLRNLRGLQLAQAAGLGGGSLIYGAVHLRAPADALAQWPEPFQGSGLDRHYERVETMLDLQVAPSDRWPKTRLMREVATKLGRQADFFQPPLAINFREGASSPACNGCGECTIGCSTGAKNTLDRNYLKEAEEHGAKIRTLCEAVAIEPGGSEPGRPARRYSVSYRDHAFSGLLRAIEADYVFLCAGALGTTELLLRSKQALACMPAVGQTQAERDAGQKQRRAALRRLGRPFFANGDALGVVFDTAREAAPSQGPTITSALYHRGTRPDAEAVGSSRPAGAAGDVPQPAAPWFLIQEGGMPPSLAPLLNLLRSPLWLGQNQLVGPGTAPHEPPRAGVERRARGAFLSRLPDLLHRRGGASAVAASGRREEPCDGAPWLDMLPPPARRSTQLLLGLRGRVDDQLRRISGEVLSRVDDRHRCLGWARRWLTRLDHERVFALTREALEGLYPAASVVLQSRNTWDMLMALARGATRLAAPLDHTLVLLAMGVDEALVLRERAPPRQWPAAVPSSAPRDEFFQARDGGSGPSRADRSCRAGVAGPEPHLRLEVVPLRRPREGEPATRARRQFIYREQERLMSDIADALGGELRTSPAWTIGRKPVTVHAQGGCAMGRVTSEDGQVLGFEGLFVMDGAAFPASVGVNPSHTIAAVAERNVERFLATLESATSDEAKLAPERAVWRVPAASAVVARDRPTAAIRTQPPSLRWSEQLRGFGASARDWPVLGGKAPLGEERARIEDYLEWERRGSILGQSFELRLSVQVKDLDALIDGTSSLIEVVGGTFTLWERDGDAQTKRGPICLSGQLELQLGGPEAAPLGRGGLVYRLQGKRDAACVSGQHACCDPSFRLYGFKELTDDPGLDAWLDLSTLYVDARVEGRLFRGVVRVSLTELLRDQLPSFEVVQEGLCRERQLWVLARFARFFIARVRRVYLPELS
jgi:choline dehydrogenase-like flavoprotein